MTYKIINSEIQGINLMEDNKVSTYAYVNCDIQFTIEHNGKDFSSNFQAGHSYKCGDYSLPSNNLSVYEGSAGLLTKLDQAVESEIDADFVAECNELFELTYDAADYLAIYNDIILARSDADVIVNEAEREYLETFEKDERFFVEQQYIEVDEFNKKQQCGETDYLVFDDKESFDEYLSNNEYSYKCSKGGYYASLNK